MKVHRARLPGRLLCSIRSNRKWCKRRGSSLQCQNCFFVYPIIDCNLKNLSISFYLLIIPYNSIRNTKILQTIPPQNRYNFKPSYLKKLFLLSSSSRIFCFITLVSVSDCFSRSFVALCIASIFACNAFLTSWTVFSLTSSFRLPISPDIAS